MRKKREWKLKKHSEKQKTSTEGCGDHGDSSALKEDTGGTEDTKAGFHKSTAGKSRHCGCWALRWSQGPSLHGSLWSPSPAPLGGRPTSQAAACPKGSFSRRLGSRTLGTKAEELGLGHKMGWSRRGGPMCRLGDPE